jgi:sigma-B regulation protein RsbU (phosphoserine phosphatase)
VGAVEDSEYREDTETLHPGDLVFLYTDGLTEAMDTSLNLYSESRLVAWLENNGRGAVEDIVDEMVEDVKRFEAGADQADDLTILAVVFHGDVGAGQYEALKLELSNQLPEVERLNVAFSEFAEKSNVPKRTVDQFKLVFDELLTNIVSHAYSDDGKHTIFTDIRVFGDKIVATIADDGKFFNPLKYGRPLVEASIDERKVGGLGIHLVRNVMDEVRYRRAGETNVVSVVKYLDASVQAAAASLPDTSHDEKS